MRKCEICGKGSRLGGKRNLSRAHYNPTPLKRKYPNLQYVKVNGKRLLVCSDCRRTLKKTN
jgi:ribosomal protein L28